MDAGIAALYNPTGVVLPTAEAAAHAAGLLAAATQVRPVGVVPTTELAPHAVIYASDFISAVQTEVAPVTPQAAVCSQVHFGSVAVLPFNCVPAVK